MSTVAAAMVDKHTTRSSARPSACQLNDFATRGWVCVRNLLSSSEVRVLQTECSALYSSQSAETLIAQGCVVDVLAHSPIRESDKARVDSKCYLECRARATNRFDMEKERVLASLLFEKLPTIAAQMMAGRNESETESPVFFFNEHYVVKPPRSHVEFRWHRDGDEQLAMCVHRESIGEYVSAWCALDNVTSVNGALQFVSLDASLETNEDTDAALHRQASAPVAVEEGDVLFFLSNVWHYSSSNESDSARRAFYAQYSRERITSRRNSSSPLSFAIPCTRTSLTSTVSAPTGYREP
uniref:Phytanoyl-CoA dioxygenase n=1 Tax=Peronospora matthiolae TaxID=2874970 RepID=A0AAV1TS00_9STRA